jgi:hypothetical protein
MIESFHGRSGCNVAGSNSVNNMSYHLNFFE